MSATYRKDGWYPCVPEAIDGLSAKEFAGTPVEKAFKEHTPDPGAFDAYLEKMKVLNAEDQNISDEQMRSISAQDDGHHRRCRRREAGACAGDVRAARWRR